MASCSDFEAPLPRSFYARPVLVVARELLGKVLIHRTSAGLLAGRIVEVEAYRGPEDRAAHSYGGRRTERTEAMYGPPGHAYVFFVYGMHWHFNIVTTREGAPHAVLVRAVEPLVGKELMAKNRSVSSEAPTLTNGPGKLCQAFGIDRRCYGRDLTDGELIVSDGPRVRRVGSSARIGVGYAGAWAGVPWRFFDPGSGYVSRARPSAEVCKIPR